MVLGMVRPDAGKITVLGEPVPVPATLARVRIGVVPQFDDLELEFTVRENLLVFGRYFRMSAREIEAIVPSLLEFARLESKTDARVAGLSGGMKRRLTLARALINDPHLLIMDEPTTGLDPHGRHLGTPAITSGPRQDDSFDHSLYGRGRAVVRSAVCAREWSQDLRRQASLIR